MGPTATKGSWASTGEGRRRTEEQTGEGGRVDQVWTPGVRVSAAKMDWLISKHLNPSMSEAVSNMRRWALIAHMHL